MTVLSGDALPLVREARRATETKKWVRNALMVNAEDHAVVAYFSGDEAHLRVTQTEGTIGCDDVVGCCTFGYVQYARVCLSPLLPAYQAAVAESEVAQAIRAVLWDRADVRTAVIEALDDAGFVVDSADNGEWDGDTADDMVGEMNSGDGLIPWWNDNLAQSADDVRDLFDAVIEGGEQDA